jgi:hypothetical protein
VSWNDILVAKLQHDVPHLHVPCNGSLLLTMSQCKEDRQRRSANLDASVRVLINNQPEGDRMFIGGDRLVATVVFALHGLDITMAIQYLTKPASRAAITTPTCYLLTLKQDSVL